MNNKMDDKHLPFSEEQLLRHFSTKKEGKIWVENKKHLNYYKKSLQRFHDYQDKNLEKDGRSIEELKGPYQVEKDERFWMIKYLLTWYCSENRKEIMINLLEGAFGPVPPLSRLSTWEECLEGKIELFFEVRIPSNPGYGKKWLRCHLDEQQIVPYVKSAAKGKKRSLEGATCVDAILVNSENGFGVFLREKYCQILVIKLRMIIHETKLPETSM